MTTSTAPETDRARALRGALCRAHDRLRPVDVEVVMAGDDTATLTAPTAAPGVVWKAGLAGPHHAWIARVDPADHAVNLEAARVVPLPMQDPPPVTPVFNAEAVEAATETHIATIRNAIQEAQRGCRDVEDTDDADVMRWRPKIQNLDWLAPERSDFDPRLTLKQMVGEGLAPRQAVQAFVRALADGRAHITSTMPALRQAIIAAEMPTGHRLADFQNLGTRQAPKLSAIQEAHDRIGDALDRLEMAITAVAPLVPQFEGTAARRVRTVKVLVAEGATAIRDVNRQVLEARIERLINTVMEAEHMVEDT